MEDIVLVLLAQEQRKKHNATKEPFAIALHVRSNHSKG